MKTDHAHFFKLCLLKGITWFESQHFRFFEDLNIHNESRWGNKNHFQSRTSCVSVTLSNHSHFPKLCLLKCVILFNEQHFRVFESSNIDNENKWVNKNHFLSSTLCISVEIRKFQRWSCQVFKTVSAQMGHFASKTRFSNFSAVEAGQSWKTSFCLV